MRSHMYDLIESASALGTRCGVELVGIVARTHLVDSLQLLKPSLDGTGALTAFFTGGTEQQLAEHDLIEQ